MAESRGARAWARQATTDRDRHFEVGRSSDRPASRHPCGGLVYDRLARFHIGPD